MQLIDGKALSEQFKERIREEVLQLVAKGYRAPHLVAILVGEDPASHTYVRNKTESCRFVGFEATQLHLPASVSEEELLDHVRAFNNDPGVDGMIVQMPLPAHIYPQYVIEAILPHKDADGFHPHNVGMMTLGYPGILPATPRGILEMLSHYNIPTQNKHCVVIGRSRIVGRPVSILLSRGGEPGEATVTVCHSRTSPELLRQLTLQADILVVAAGRPGVVTGDMVKEGAVVIDVGTNRVEAPGTKSGFRLKGDVDFESVAPKTSFITPVPGGVGPMTVAMLLQNTLESYLRHLDQNGF
ncbi:MAG: bifunctional 5,10-methylenetetrahydrofolate dehydrogenase/5,10-methenyltetrahydrofolate cyclohydrolase [Bacteroidetes bacterium]|nr:MAG: bifunctional 5,10-methylenetetrahydrofolate dehydrogenase/5,10-methenyltetrahydrofolate cyclohydrolase [Bacteroidota bacterium]